MLSDSLIPIGVFCIVVGFLNMISGGCIDPALLAFFGVALFIMGILFMLIEIKTKQQEIKQ